MYVETPLSEQFMVVITLQAMTNMGVISPDKPTKILDSVRLNAPDYFVVSVFSNAVIFKMTD